MCCLAAPKPLPAPPAPLSRSNPSLLGKGRPPRCIPAEDQIEPMTAPTETSPRASAKARRSGSATRRRYANLTLRLLPEERAHIEVAAERAGVSLGAYVRSRLIAKSAIRAVRRPTVETAALAQLLAQVGRIGGNIHQIVRRVNFGEGVARAEIMAALADWRAIAGQIMQAMGRGKAGHADPD